MNENEKTHQLFLLNKRYQAVLFFLPFLLYVFVGKPPRKGLRYRLQQYSVDEVWVTVNGLQKLFGNRWEIARKIKSDILDRFGMTSSIGIGDNKFLAKVVMDLHAKKTGIADTKMYQKNCGRHLYRIFGELVTE